MRHSWAHAGRIWTNGEPFPAMDAPLREHWHGDTGEDAFEAVCDLGWEATSPVGPGRAALVRTDGVVGDEGWLEVFTAGHGALAVVQVSGTDYGSLLLAALGHEAADATSDRPRPHARHGSRRVRASRALVHRAGR
jgi:hypothetical protein